MNFEDYRTIKNDLVRQFWEDSSGNRLKHYFILENDDPFYGFSMLLDHIKEEVIAKATLPNHGLIFYSPELAMDPGIGFCVFVRFKPGDMTKRENQAIRYCMKRLELPTDDIVLVHPQNSIGSLNNFMTGEPLTLSSISETGEVSSSEPVTGFAALYHCGWPFNVNREEDGSFEGYEDVG